LLRWNPKELLGRQLVEIVQAGSDRDLEAALDQLCLAHPGNRTFIGRAVIRRNAGLDLIAEVTFIQKPAGDKHCWKVVLQQVAEPSGSTSSEPEAPAESGPPSPEASPRPTVDQKTVLFIEDDSLVLKLYQNRLEREGYRVLIAEDGLVGRQMLASTTPDLIVLDLMLPKIHGLELLASIRADASFQVTPVLVLSNPNMEELAAKALKTGANKVLLKTQCTPALLLGLAQDLLGGAPAPEPDQASSRVPRASAAEAGQAQTEDSASDDRDPDLLQDALQEIARVRQDCLQFVRTAGSQANQAHLESLYRGVRYLVTRAGFTGHLNAAAVAGALEALLFEVVFNYLQTTPSVLQTIAQAVDCLARLFRSGTTKAFPPDVKPKVLVVDDDAVCNFGTVVSLKRAKFDAIGVQDPKAGLGMMQTTPFDLVLLDVNMPGLSGFELCEKLRQLPEHQNTPVIFVTAGGEFQDRARGILAGGNDLITKPVSRLELILKATMLLHDPPGQRPSPSKARSEEPKPPSPLGSPTEATASPHLSGPGGATKLTTVAPASHPTDRVTVVPREDKPQLSAPRPTEPSRQQAEERCRQLERNVAELQQAHEQLQARCAREQGAAKLFAQRIAELDRERQARAADLDQAKAALTEQLAYRKKLETQLAQQAAQRGQPQPELRAELESSTSAAQQAETGRQQAQARCGQLERDLAELQQAREQLQARYLEEQQAAATSAQWITELEKELQGRATELDRAQAALSQQTAQKEQLEAQLKQQAAEQQKLETQLRQQAVEQEKLEAQLRAELESSTSAAQQAETGRQQAQARCGQLERDLAELQQAREQLQARYLEEQQAAATSAQRIGELERLLAEARTAHQAALSELENRLRLGADAVSRLTVELDRERSDRHRLEDRSVSLVRRLQELNEALSRSLADEGDQERRIALLEKDLHEHKEVVARLASDLTRETSDRQLAQDQWRAAADLNDQLKKQLAYFEESVDLFKTVQADLQARLIAGLDKQRENESALLKETAARQRLEATLDESQAALRARTQRVQALEADVQRITAALRDCQSGLQHEAVERQRLAGALDEGQRALRDQSQRSDIEASRLRSELQLAGVDRQQLKTEILRLRHASLRSERAGQWVRSALRSQIGKPVDDIYDSARRLLQSELADEARKLAAAVMADALSVRTRLQETEPVGETGSPGPADLPR
jgi:DNA-binding response OmpR family regulator